MLKGVFKGGLWDSWSVCLSWGRTTARNLNSGLEEAHLGLSVPHLQYRDAETSQPCYKVYNKASSWIC